MSKKPKEHREVLFTFTPKPEPCFGLGAYVLATGEQAVISIIEWLPKIGWIYYLTDKLKSYRLSVFNETEFASFGARLAAEAA